MRATKGKTVWLVFFAALALGACIGTKEKSQALIRDRSRQAATPSSDLHENTIEQIKQAGDQSLVTIVARPRYWAAFRARATAAVESALLNGWAVPKKSIEHILSAPTALAALTRAAGFVAGKDVEEFDTWRDWDPARSIVAAIGEVSDDYVTPLTFALLNGKNYQKPTGFRHRLLIPAKNSEALSNRTRELFAHLGWKSIQNPDPLPSGASCHSSKELGGFLVVIPEKDYVRIEATSDEAFVFVFGARTKETDIEVAAAQYHEMMTGICRELVEKPRGAGNEPPTSPAMHLVVSSQGDFISVLMRTWRFRPLGAYVSLNKSLKAISYADASENNRLLAKALEESIAADRLMSPVVAEVDDIGLSVSHEKSFRVTQVISLSELGRKILAKGYSLGEKEVVTDFQSRAFDVKAAWSVAPGHPVFSEEEGIAKAKSMLKECGSMCILNMRLRGRTSVMKSLYLFAKNQDRRHMDSIFEQGGAVYDTGLVIPNLMKIKDFSRKAIAGRALVGEYEYDAARPEFRIDIERLSKTKWQSPERSMVDAKSYTCFERVRRRAFDALWILIYWGNKPEDEFVLNKALAEMEEMAECTRSNPVLSAKADAIIDFIKRSRLGLGKSEGKASP